LQTPLAGHIQMKSAIISKLEDFVRSHESAKKAYLLLVGIMYRMRNPFARVRRLTWRLSTTQVSETARIHPSAYVSRFKVRIGPDCVIGPHAVVYENSILDDKVDLGAGCVVGSEGFVCRTLGKKVFPVLHTGGVHIHRKVRIQSQSCVDRSTRGGYTEIGEESCIGEQVHVAHNVTLGRRCQIEPQSMIAGHVIMGDNVRISRNVSVSDSLKIGSQVMIGPGAVVTRNARDGESLSGNFAIESAKHHDFVKSAERGEVEFLP